MTELPLVRFPLTTVYRIIPSRFPTVDLYREVAPAEDWLFLQSFAMRTNSRLLEEQNPTGLVRPEDRVERSNSHYILAPLTRPNPQASRFADDTFGVLYVGLDFETTQAEVIVQREAFLRSTSQRPQRIDMRVILLDLQGELHDARELAPAIMNDVALTRALGGRLRSAGSYGIVFKSLVQPEGPCVAVFRPTVLSHCRQERHLGYVWNGDRITDVVEYSLRTGIQAAT